MMTDPLISVKMITYNHEPYIAKAIESILSQMTSYSFELIIGEDCSTDKTRQIIFDYQRKYPELIRVICSDKNVGMKKNSIRTSQACRGKYIAFCEGDDYWHCKEKLQMQIDYLENHSECGMVFTDMDVFHVKTGKTIESYFHFKNWEIPENPNIQEIVDGKSHIMTCTVVIIKDLYFSIIESDSYLHRMDTFLMGDTQLWAECATKKAVHYMPTSTATYVVTQESATRSKNILKPIKFGISNMEMLLYLCKKYQLSENSIKKYEDRLLSYKLLLAYHTHDSSMAKEIMKRKEQYSLKEQLLYMGALNRILFYLFNTITNVVRRYRLENPDWQ